MGLVLFLEHPVPLSMLHLPGEFGPSELDAVSAAKELALAEISEGSSSEELSGREIRRRMAAAIISEARAGVFDRDQLKSAGLRAVTLADDLAGSAPAQPI